ncbi:hypothetical protein [Salipiger bermudensis]|uniref:Tryptophan-rich sensory protein n=1 Tax=Salipiger bermudensis (strain DSM 26914 / JCM 13377 / KCTC 12554 / HTCC2601) TaxID=314265 RepID=Q0FIT0_SALBH|nr:hypothetical protein [Salipiger bermudensis]EAU44124.1 hypothetical protein R2601_12216 [Salipiger bermudensis HTCC2601]
MRRALAPLVLLLAIAFAVSPAVTGGFPGLSPTQFPVVQSRWPVQPVGWAFSIWGAIFLLLIGGAAYGLWRRRLDPAWQAMRGPLAVSLGLGMFWVAASNWQPVLATVLIIFMAAAATEALLRAPRAWAARLPVGLYAGWLTAAAGVAIGASLSGYGVLSAQAAALVLLSLLLVIAGFVLWLRPSALAYAFGVGWAYMGVIVANREISNTPVIALAAAGIALVVAVPLLRRAGPA